MIQTWIADVTSLLEEEKYQAYYQKLPDWRKEKADRMHYPIDRALSVGVWILFEKMKIEYNLRGDVSFNLSHSGNYAMCSVDDTGNVDVQVGCDIEKDKEPRMKLARRFFCESEYQRIEAEPSMFFRFWVLKESFMKVTRLGMKLALDTFEFDFTDEGEAILIRKPDDIEGEYYFKEYEKEGVPYRMAVSSNCDQFADNVYEVNL